MAANETAVVPKSTHEGLKFKKGAYLTPKVERIMMHIARRRNVKWIANLLSVRESVVVYVGRKTGFPPAALVGHDPKLFDKHMKETEEAFDAAAVREVDEHELEKVW